MATVDGPVIQAEALSSYQRSGRSCCWCSDWADSRFPVPPLRAAGLLLLACETCAGQFGIAPVEVDR